MGHIRQSFMICQIFLMVRPSRLCMLDFDGSSLRTRLTIMISSLGSPVSQGMRGYRSAQHTVH